MQNLPRFKLIIGLGNPDAQYARTYHNVGIFFIDALLGNDSVKPTRTKSFDFYKAENYTLIKSSSYMNQSGAAVRDVLSYFKAKPEEILIIHDDSDLLVGSYKFSFGRSAAGHHGIESIIAFLGTPNIWRLRIGIRTAAETKRKKASEIVLKKITPKDRRIFLELAHLISLKFRPNETPEEVEDRLVSGNPTF